MTVKIPNIQVQLVSSVNFKTSLKMKNIYTLVCLFGAILMVPFNSNAQQESQFGNFIHNPYLFNPAAGGMYNLAQIDIGYRNQWLAATGNPTTMYVSGSTQIFGKNTGVDAIGEFNTGRENIYQTPERTVGSLKQVVGAKFLYDGIGPFSKTSFFASYGVHMPLTKTFNIGVGLGAGYGNFQIDHNRVVLHDANDQVYNQFAGQNVTQNILDVQSGLVVYSNRFLFSLSGTQLVNNKVSVQQMQTGNNLNRHLLIMSSYSFKTTDVVDIEPFVMVKAVKGSPTSFDIGARVKYNKSIWAGLQYRTGNSFVVSAGMNFLRNFNFSYAFEYGTKAVRISAAGTHELQLGILIGNNRNTDKEIEKSKKKAKVTTEETL